MAQTKSRSNAFQKSKKTRRQRLMAASQDLPSSTKKPGTIVPPPQSTRIMQRYVSGESIRQIAREEGRDRATVTKIVRSDEMQSVVQKWRERLYGLGSDCLGAVEYALQERKDARLGYQILTDIGVVPSAEERHAIATQPMNKEDLELTPFEIAVAEDENGRINQVAYGMACAIEESAKNFGTYLPTAEEYRHSQRVAEVAEEIAGGNFRQICFTDGSEEKRIRGLAEQKVRREEARKSLPPRRAQPALPNKKRSALASSN
jgi:hypothetical protein